MRAAPLPPHTVSSTQPSSDTDQDGGSNSNGNGGPRGGRSGSGSGRVKDIEREKREERRAGPQGPIRLACGEQQARAIWEKTTAAPAVKNDGEGEDEEEEK